MSKRGRASGADAVSHVKPAEIETTSAAGNGADAPDNFKVHLLDVGEEKYGDCVLCQFGNVSILIDGSHRGDDSLVTRQLKRLLKQQTLPVRVSLLIVSHPHDDHIGCLPSLVANDHLRADWALVADPKFRWGDTEDAEDFFAGADYRARSLTEALLEEDRSDLPDDELGLFIDNAGTLVNRYRTMLRQLEERGTRVVRNGTDNTADLLAEFAGVGLKIVGPTRDHLREAARLLHDGSRDSLDFVGDAFAADTTMDVINAYRNLMGGVLADWHNPNKGAINLQSLVTRFEYRGERFIFAGDMQFSAPEVESEKLTAGVDAMLAAISSEAPYSFVKISHHGSYNGIDDKVLAAFGGTKLYGICGGAHGASHPHPEVLQLLGENNDRLDWVRTDRNGLVSITFGGAEPQIKVRRGEISDPVPKSPVESDFTDFLAEPATEFEAETGASPLGSLQADRPLDAGEVRTIVPPNATRVSLTVDFAPSAPQPQADPTTSAAFESGTAVESSLAEDTAADTRRTVGPPRSALVQQFNRARANGWIEFFAEGAQRFNWPTALLMAIASRETNMRNILGDGGHGHGIMQIDDRSFPDFTSSGRWRVPRLNILKGAEVLSGKRQFLSRRGVAGETLMRASVAAYNGGEGRVIRAITRGLSVDSVTTQRNYSADVLARAAVFRELLG